MASRSTQLAFDLGAVPRWGGRREGAGRPRGSGSRDPHRRRAPLAARFPCHVTLRIRRGIPSLRKARLVREWRRSLREACERGRFRVVHYSLQRDHAHLLVEAASARDLACGMKSIGARLARAVQRAFRRRGPVLADRYHLRVLRTPREVRNALAYVLLNVRKHWRERHGALTSRAPRRGLLGPLVRRLAPRARLARAAARSAEVSRGRAASDLAALARLAAARPRRSGGGSRALRPGDDDRGPPRRPSQRGNRSPATLPWPPATRGVCNPKQAGSG